MNVGQAISILTDTVEKLQRKQWENTKRIERLEQQIIGLVLACACLLALVAILATLTLSR